MTYNASQPPENIGIFQKVSISPTQNKLHVYQPKATLHTSVYSMSQLNEYFIYTR